MVPKRAKYAGVFYHIRPDPDTLLALAVLGLRFYVRDVSIKFTDGIELQSTTKNFRRRWSNGGS